MKERFISFMQWMTNSILPVIFWVLLIFGFDAPYFAVLTLLSALIHELGHILSILAFGGIMQMPRGHISGFRIKRHTALTYRREIFILLSGPMANIAASCIGLLFIGNLGEYAVAFVIINTATAISNLLPIEGYDGYGIMFQIFSSRNMSLAIRMLERSSFVIMVVLTFLSLYLIEKFGSGYWIFAMFFCMMIAKLTKFGNFNIFEE